MRTAIGGKIINGKLHVWCEPCHEYEKTVLGTNVVRMNNGSYRTRCLEVAEVK